MKYKFISDSHTHSDNSFDGKDSVIMLAERACSLGLYSLTVTDHCECNEYFEKDIRKDIERSVRDIHKAKGLYADKLKIYTGIELGQPTQAPDAARDALSLAEYDFVLGSLHNIKNEKDFFFIIYTPENTEGLINRYFDELTELVKSDCFDSLAHMTYPFRYLAGNADINVDIKKYSQRIDAILELLIKNRKALEVNTSGLRQVIGRTLPDEDIVRRFRELGGKYVTVGSDAHRWGDIGAGIEDGYNMLLRCGFTHFTVYREHQPELLPIL